MLRLLTILSGSLIYVNCDIHTGNQRLGYYIVGSYNIYQCNNVRSKTITSEHIKYHELGHLFRYMWLGKKTDSETYAENFAYCMENNKCKHGLIKYIIKITEKPSN